MELVLLLFSITFPHQDEYPGHMQIHLRSYQIIASGYMEEKKVLEKIDGFYCSLERKKFHEDLLLYVVDFLD